MPLDPRHNPDPNAIRGRRYYAVDGIDARDGIQIRALFEAFDDSAAVHAAMRNGFCGDLYEVPAAVYPEWVRWADSLIRTHTRIVLPLPGSGVFLGRLELARGT